MELLKILMITLILVILAVGALSIRLLFVKDGKFSGGSCRSTPELEREGITCGCGNESSCGAGKSPA